VAAIPTLANGDTCNATAQYNLLVEALATIGITDTDQLYAIFEELRLKDATTLLDRSGVNLQLTDAVTGPKLLTELAGNYATPMTWGQGGNNVLGVGPPTLIPIRFLKTVRLIGVRMYCGILGGSPGTVQYGIYSDEATMQLLAPSPVTVLVPSSENTILLTAPYDLLADRTYWLLYCPLYPWGPIVKPTLLAPMASRVYYTGAPIYGLPQTINMSSNTYSCYIMQNGGYYGAVPPGFALILDGGMAFS